MAPTSGPLVRLHLRLLCLPLLAAYCCAPTVGALWEPEANFNPLGCNLAESRQHLSDECRILKLFKQQTVDEMDFKDSIGLARYCACELSSMPWEEAYDDTASTRRLESMVASVLQNDKYKDSYPVYLWSDADILMNGVSIYTSTRDYFDKRRKNSSIGLISAEQMEKDQVFRTTRNVCFKISQDRLKLYQYLENLGRLSPLVFYDLVRTNEFIHYIYQASKACKLLIVHKLSDFKLRPDNRLLVAVDRMSPRDEFELNDIAYQTNGDDFDTALRDASVYLLNCKPWQRVKLDLLQLANECPMMFNEEIPATWSDQHPLVSERSQMAIKCGCQLLLHNSTWNTLIQDPNIMKLNKALTNYINANKFPQLNESPLWAIYGWFNNLMDKFVKDRSLSVREIVKLIRGEEDLTVAMNRQAKDEMFALDVARRACVLLVFNRNKSITSEQVSELKLIKYLDNLRYISRDPMFVFHLTLQDANLFKLHALSKLCEPFIK